jgi:hypothetical protein
MWRRARRCSFSSPSSSRGGLRIVVRSWGPVGVGPRDDLFGLGVREDSVCFPNKPYVLRRDGGGRGGVVRDLAGDAARDDASDDATIAFASESTVALDADLGRGRRLEAVFRLGGREGWTSEAETKESSEEAEADASSAPWPPAPAPNLDGMGIGFVAERGVLRGSGSGMVDLDTGLDDAFDAIETGLGDMGGCGGLDETTCFWGITEAVRETGSDLEESIGFDAPGKAIGEVGFGDLISGFGFWRGRGTGDGDGERYTGDF